MLIASFKKRKTFVVDFYCGRWGFGCHTTCPYTCLLWKNWYFSIHLSIILFEKTCRILLNLEQCTENSIDSGVFHCQDIPLRPSTSCSNKTILCCGLDPTVTLEFAVGPFLETHIESHLLRLTFFWNSMTSLWFGISSFICWAHPSVSSWGNVHSRFTQWETACHT